ncbi:MAG: pre-16S rRNA-processing nuclease YqgF [Bacillota bacterium]|nr:pre-16S rRNA-processing nuclease YqgF [Bacillota bacterium]
MDEGALRYIAAVDPGRDKAGIALVQTDGRVVAQLIVPPTEVVERLSQWQREYGLSAIVLGDRTGARAFRAALQAAGLPGPACSLVSVDEHLSTQEARRRYLSTHPGRGLSRWLPASLRTPDRPVDDYVAVILAERYLRKSSGNQ